MPKHIFRLEQLFGSQTRARLLSLFLLHQHDAFFVRELTRKIDAQLNSVRRELKNLMELGLVTERAAEGKIGKSLADKKKFYVVNAESILFHDLRALFTKVQILLKQNLVEEIEGGGEIDYLVFTGRFIGNTEIPTDILIVGSIDAKELQRIVGEFEKELGHEINYTLLPKDEFLYRRQVMDRFLFSITEGEKIVMVNRLHL